MAVLRRPRRYCVVRGVTASFATLPQRLRRYLASVKVRDISVGAAPSVKVRRVRDSAVGVLETSGKARSVRSSPNNTLAFVVFRTGYVS